jgi:hypothetical protein
VDLGCGQKHFFDQISNPYVWGNNDWIWAFFFFHGEAFNLRMHFKKRIARTLLQVFFAVVNGGRVVDTRRIFT